MITIERIPELSERALERLSCHVSSIRQCVWLFGHAIIAHKRSHIDLLLLLLCEKTHGLIHGLGRCNHEVGRLSDAATSRNTRVFTLPLVYRCQGKTLLPCLISIVVIEVDLGPFGGVINHTGWQEVLILSRRLYYSIFFVKVSNGYLRRQLKLLGNWRCER